MLDRWVRVQVAVHDALDNEAVRAQTSVRAATLCASVSDAPARPESVVDDKNLMIKTLEKS